MALLEEIMAWFIERYLNAKLGSEGPWDVKLQALKRRIPRLFFVRDEAYPEAFIFRSLFQSPTLFVQEKFWAELTDNEREALFFFTDALNRRGTLTRIFIPPDIRTLDRDTFIESRAPLALATLLEKAALFRAARKEAPLMQGVSMLGPSLMGEWSPVKERLELAHREYAKLV